MARTKQTIEVDREMELTVEVMESGAVTLKLTGDAVNAELGSGDRFVIVLRPLQPAGTAANPSTAGTVRTNTETFNNSGHFTWDGYHGGAGAAAEKADDTDGPLGTDRPDPSEGWGATERGDR